MVIDGRDEPSSRGNEHRLTDRRRDAARWASALLLSALLVIGAAAVGPAAAGPAALAAPSTSDLPADARQNATPIADGDVVRNGDGDPDWYALDVDAGEHVAFESLGTASVTFAVHDPDGDVVERFSSETPDAESFGFTASRSGTYYLEASPDRFYRLSVATTGADGFETNDAAGTAPAVDGSVSATVHEGDEDWFAVTVGADGHVEASLEVTDHANHRSVGVAIHDADGASIGTVSEPDDRTRLLAYDDPDSAEQRATGLDPGTYYVRVYDVEVGGFAPYDLSIDAGPVPESGGDPTSTTAAPSTTRTSTAAPTTSEPTTEPVTSSEPTTSATTTATPTPEPTTTEPTTTESTTIELTTTEPTTTESTTATTTTATSTIEPTTTEPTTTPIATPTTTSATTSATSTATSTTAVAERPASDGGQRPVADDVPTPPSTAGPPLVRLLGDDPVAKLLVRLLSGFGVAGWP